MNIINCDNGGATTQKTAIYHIIAVTRNNGSSKFLPPWTVMSKRAKQRQCQAAITDGLCNKVTTLLVHTGRVGKYCSPIFGKFSHWLSVFRQKFAHSFPLYQRILASFGRFTFS